MKFRLKQIEAGKLLTKFHILDSSGNVHGSANIPNAEVFDFLRHWQGAVVGEVPEQPSPKQSLALAFMKHRKPFRQEAILRGCHG
jgi:hypothetical protein